MSPDNDRVLVLAPHTDDGEFGCGGTISRFLQEGKKIFYAAFSTAEESVPPEFPSNILEQEVRAGTRALGIPPQNLLVYKYAVRHLPHARQEILEELVRLKREIDPGTIFLPSRQDLHQDHQTVHLEGLRAFKMATVLGYELPWNNLSFDYRHFVVLQQEHVQTKVDALRCYQSQQSRPYSKEDFIWSWARTRGVQISVDYAEAFDVLRWVLA
jgi:N-acetylglucosamine malate deacetylase 1